MGHLWAICAWEAAGRVNVLAEVVKSGCQRKIGLLLHSGGRDVIWLAGDPDGDRRTGV